MRLITKGRDRIMSNRTITNEVKYANLLKEKRIEAGLSQRKLAELSGSHYRTIQDIESGRSYPTDIYVLRRLANALGLEHADDLIDWENPIE